LTTSSPTFLSAMHRSFEVCDLRLIGRGYYMATCSDGPIQPRRFSELPASLALVDQLQQGLSQFDLSEYFEDIRISENIFERYTPHVRAENTDDHPVLEFMVVRSYQMGHMGEDPFLDRQREMNVDPVRLSQIDDPMRLARRAMAFYQMNADHFRANFAPVLKARPELWQMWRASGYDDDPNR